VRIRLARAADLEAVRGLVERAYTPYVERIGVRPGPLDDDYAERIGNGWLWVAEDDEIVGLIVLVEEADHLLIENVAVDPGRQGQGFGHALLRFAEERAAARGKPELRLYTHSRMRRNLDLYARLGYREDARRTAADRFERVFLSKRL
jgi:ribosomal protein S18 acetylase RimI-like enzyme